ncbi:MAG: phospholipase [Acidobacteriota bacterium]|jgi:phospholipase C|nr:phospholipase [Acidobacteriota bacterium]
MPQLTRRQFLYGSAAALGSLSAGQPLLWAASGGKARLPKPDKSGLKHVIVAMMENRSFDHILGWLPGADGKQAGLVYTDSQGAAFPTYPLAPDFQGCGHLDPDHSYDGGRIEYNGGLCDGWLRAANDLYAIGYYTQADLPFLGKAAPDWTVCSRYFAPIMAPTYPNRIYQHSAVTDRLDNSTALSTLPTIWDRLAAAGLNGRYYFSDIPFIALWGPKYAPITRTHSQFLQDCASGDLPEVAFVDPPFFSEDSGTSSDDHPHGDIRAGESWIYQIYRAVTTGRDWKHTVLVINFDEWGGFFEHVAPEEAPDVDTALSLRGFRVPCIIVSPFSAPGTIAQGVYDHTSILKMIEWRWSLPALAVRDAAANNLAEALDFNLQRHSIPDYIVPPFDSAACPA